MTNTPVKNAFAVLPIMMVVFALSVGAFAVTAHAQEYNGGYDLFGPGIVGGDTAWNDIGSYYTPETAWNDIGSYYTPETAWNDVGSYYTPDSYTPSYNTLSYYNTPSYNTPNYYTPNYSMPTYNTPRYNTPTYSIPSYNTPSAPRQDQSQAQSQSSYNSNPNTNTNTLTDAPVYNTNTNTNKTGPSISSASNGPVTSNSTSNPWTYSSSNLSSNPYTTSNSSTGPVTSTNTNNPNAYVAPISNTSSSNNTNTNNPTAHASTGPINISNTVNVVPVSQAQPQYLAQYTIPQYSRIAAPSCTISASNSYNTGYYNQPITLNWSSSNATSAYITPNVGTVNPSGSTIVYPQGYTTYTLTISGPGGTATCQSTANYATNNYIVPATYATPIPAPVYYSQPATPSVSLTQIPYTGFDYGPVGNTIYWMSLLAFAAAAGYLMVYYLPAQAGRAGALAFAGNLFGRRSTYADHIDAMDEGSTEEEVATSAIAPELPTQEVAARTLPTMESRRLPAQAGITTDSMIIDRSVIGAAPRIVIARA